MSNLNGDEDSTKLSDSSPFFLKEIDISTEILTSDPNEKQEISIKNNLLGNPDEQHLPYSKSNTHDPFENEAKIDIIDISGNDEKINSLEDHENVVNPFYFKRMVLSGDVTKSNTERAYPDGKNFAKVSPLIQNLHKRESTDSNSSALIEIEENTSQCSISSRESSAHEEDYASNIRVVVRVRPLSSAEKQHRVYSKTCVKYPGGGSIMIDGANQSKSFTFNVIFPEDCTQDDVFQQSGIKDLIDKALDGFSCTVFAFGPTGSGKTHTIIGPSEQIIEDLLDNQDLCGLIGRSFRYLFESVDKRSSVQYIIKASFLEVYNEKVKDLLNPSNAYDTLPVRWSSKKGFYVENLFLVECDFYQDLMTLLVEGSNYRQVGVHAINEHSSRSHTIFTVYLESEETNNDDEEGFQMVRHGKISFIDLAGSERVKETKTSMEGLAESNNINKSLLVLGNCISALGDRKKRGNHIPYRDSKLTKLLADSLGGEGFTLMIACISPSSHSSQDTMNALRYANRAKNIRNKPVVKLDPKEQLTQRLKREIKLLRAENNYFRQQQGVPCSECQILITPSQFEGELTPNSFGVLSPAIGCETLSSLQSSRNNSSKDILMSPSKDILMSPSKDILMSPSKDLLMSPQTGKNSLYDILQEYMNENENLKSENMTLHCSRASAHRQQEEMARENDRLTRKLDELGRVMLTSPISRSRENVDIWMKEKNDGIEVEASQEEKVRKMSESVKLPPVRKVSVPNYITVDAFADVRSNQVKTRRMSEIKSNLDQIIHSNLIKQDTTKSQSDPTICRITTNDSTNMISDNIDNKEKGSIIKTSDCNKIDDNPDKARQKKESIKSKKNFHQKTWIPRKKPPTVEKPCSYAAQFAARKEMVASKSSSQSQKIISQPASTDQNQSSSVLYDILFFSQPTPLYNKTPYQSNTYMNTPYNSGYPSQYMGLTPSQVGSGIHRTSYESMENQLQQDLESLNGHLRTDVDNNKMSRPSR